MRRHHRILVAAGLLAPACTPTPTAHRGAPRDESAVSAPSAEAAVSAGGEGEPPSSTPPASIEPAAAPTTTVTVTVPTTVARSTTTTALKPFVLPERQDEDYSDVEWLIRQTFPETPDKAVRVARCESTLDPGAVSPDGANWGLMQVNVVHKGLAARMGYSWGQMLQAGPNLAVARAVYDRAGGWGPWSCA